MGAIPPPFCLMGGWSVYLTVNESFKRATGRDYLGSRDIDLGFHFNPRWKRKEFKNSPLGIALTKIKAMGFEEESFRFVKRYHRLEGRELTYDESQRLPQYDIFNLYIDILVDSKDPIRFKLAGFKILDEPLLARVFAGKEYLKTELYKVDVLIPTPEILIKMKIKSFPDRTQDDKKTKDLTNICALLLYSSYSPIGQTIQGKRIRQRYKKALTETTKEEWEHVVTALDINISTAKRIARLMP